MCGVTHLKHYSILGAVPGGDRVHVYVCVCVQPPSVDVGGFPGQEGAVCLTKLSSSQLVSDSKDIKKKNQF